MKKVDLNNLFTNIAPSHTAGFVHYVKGKRNYTPYGEMREDVVKAAEYLHQKGVGHGTYVGIYGDNEYDWVIHDLACIYLGAISVPVTDLNTSFLKDGGVDLQFFISNQAHPEIENTIEFSAYKTNQVRKAIEPHEFNDDSIFTLLFTSGTTGLPKAIEVRKKSFDLLAQNGMAFYAIAESDKLIAFLPLSVYLQRVYVYIGLLFDLEIVLANSNTVFNIIQKEKPTILIAIPHLFETVRQMFVAKVKSKKFGKIVLALYLVLRRLGIKKRFSPFINVFGGEMRLLISGSAPLNIETYKFYKNMGLQIFQAYGMNEIGIIAANYPGKNKPGAVGKPLPEMKISFNSKQEIVVESDYLTNTTYRIGSAETYNGSNAVNTLDIGFLDEDGFLHITGRSASTIILSNGVKISPETEEAKIEAIRGAKNCLVFSKNDDFAEATISIDDYTKKDTIIQTIKKLQREKKIAPEILKINVISEGFSTENGLLTKSLKKNRN